MNRILYLIFFTLSSLVIAQAQNLAKVNIAKQYLQTHQLPEGLDTEDFLISDMYTDKDGNTYIYFTQAINGIPIHNAITPIVVSKSGKAYNSGHRVISDAKGIISSGRAAISAEQALLHSAKALEIMNPKLPILLRSDAKNEYYFDKAEFTHNPITVMQKYYYDGKQLRLGYSMDMDLTRSADYYNIIVDAQTGSILSKHNYLVSCQLHKDNYTHEHSQCGASHAAELNHASIAKSEMISQAGAQYNIFPLPYESPTHGPQTLVTDPHFADASPYGWHDTNAQEGAEYTTTRGNNVHSYLDKDDDDLADDEGPDGGDDLIFDFEYDPTLEPLGNSDLAQTNLFYTVNMIHDITHRLGFDEKAGNFQQNNYGNGGIGTDYILAQALDGFELAEPSLDNANFSTPPDGGNGRMQMYLWQRPSGEVYITEPTELKGFIAEYGTADFGSGIPILDADPIEGQIALADDGSAQGNTDACEPLVNPEEIDGKVAMVDRGSCTFQSKTRHCEDAGAIAVIICNVVGAGGDGEEIINMTGDEGDAVSIPTIFIAKSKCDAIKASILSDIDVSIYLKQREIEGNRYLDGSLDNGIIAHENGHGISNRLVGGPSAAGCLNSEEQSGEGISDFFTLLLTTKDGATREDTRGIGNYATDKSEAGRGIRQYPYSTNLDVNPLVYDDLLTINTANEGFIYNVGEIWTSLLFEMYWNFVDKYGLDTTWEDEESGNYKTGRLVIAGMASQPCNASFIEARDAILMADTLIYNGENAKLIWEAFAKRGLGYKATETEGGDNIKDGHGSYEPYPLVIEELKINKQMVSVVSKDDIVDVTIDIANHEQVVKESVTVTDQIPAGMSYVDGSASTTHEISGNNIIFSIGDMDYKDEMQITYQLKVLDNIESKSIYFEDVEELRETDWNRESIEGTDRWEIAYEAPTKSGEAAWYMEEFDTEIDQILIMPEFKVVGKKPVLKFWHRFETEAGNDGGFIQISPTGGETWFNVNDQFIRNGYNGGIAYGTFAIPSLEGFSGSSGNEYIDSYLDLSDYIGQDIQIRFRYGTNEADKVDDEYAGWLLDDFEIIDLQAEGTIACVASEQESDIQCTPVLDIFYQPLSSGPDAVEDITDQNNMSVYPNPATDIVSISLRGDVKTDGNISVKDIFGRTLKTQSIYINGGKQIRSFDVSDLAPGTYFVELRTEKGVTAQKLVIQ